MFQFLSGLGSALGGMGSAAAGGLGSLGSQAMGGLQGLMAPSVQNLGLGQMPSAMAQFQPTAAAPPNMMPGFGGMDQAAAAMQAGAAPAMPNPMAPPPGAMPMVPGQVANAMGPMDGPGAAAAMAAGPNPAMPNPMTAMTPEQKAGISQAGQNMLGLAAARERNRPQMPAPRGAGIIRGQAPQPFLMRGGAQFLGR